MKLGTIIKRYRKEHDLSLRDFAAKSGVSNSYLSMLETGRQPSSGKPVIPTLTKLSQIASAMGLRVDDLVAMVDDMPISLNDFPSESNNEDSSLVLSPLEKHIIARFRTLSEGERNMILRSLGLEEEIRGGCTTQSTA